MQQPQRLLKPGQETRSSLHPAVVAFSGDFRLRQLKNTIAEVVPEKVI